MIETTLKVLEKAHKKQKSVCLIGNYGIGKSAIIYQYAQEKAQELGKELVFWHELSEQQKSKIIENPEKYFIVIDIKPDDFLDKVNGSMKKEELGEKIKCSCGNDKFYVFEDGYYLTLVCTKCKKTHVYDLL